MKSNVLSAIVIGAALCAGVWVDRGARPSVIEAQSPSPEPTLSEVANGLKMPAAPTSAQNASAFVYQGQLRKNGAPVNASCDASFALFDAATGGAQVGGTVTSATMQVANGLFTIALDFGWNFTGEARWLETAVGCGETQLVLSPRTAIRPAPYAFALPGLRTVPGNTDLSGNVTMNVIAGVVSGTIYNWIDPSSYNGAIGGGSGNFIQIGSPYSSLGGGQGNRIERDSDYSSIGGGYNNKVDNASARSAIGGGWGNVIDMSAMSFVGGGVLNQIGYGAESTIVAGGGNVISQSAYSMIGGGLENRIDSGGYGVIGGGWLNQVKSVYAHIGGGSVNRIESLSDDSAIGGGAGNVISGSIGGAISGGLGNRIDTGGHFATVGGGADNRANGYSAVIGGGSANHAGGDYSAVPGGAGNRAQGIASLAAGSGATAVHNGTYVWSDGTGISSTAPNQYLIRAAGGVGVNTNTPARALDVNGKIGVFDGGTRTYYGGLASELGGQMIEIGINDDAVNRFGGAYNSAAQGGLMRVDARGGGEALFQFYGRPAGGVTLNSLATLNAGGVFAAAGGFNGWCRTDGAVAGGPWCNQDVAETFATVQPTEPGDVVVIAKSVAGQPAVEKSSQAYDARLVGVVSANPGLLFDNGQTRLAGDNSNRISADKTVVAALGRVRVKVSLESGAIAAGDPLAAGSAPGTAMRATRAGRILGYALQGSDEMQDGLLLMWLQIGAYAPREPEGRPGDAQPTEAEALQAQVSMLQARNTALEARLAALERAAATPAHQCNGRRCYLP